MEVSKNLRKIFICQKKKKKKKIQKKRMKKLFSILIFLLFVILYSNSQELSVVSQEAVSLLQGIESINLKIENVYQK